MADALNGSKGSGAKAIAAKDHLQVRFLLLITFHVSLSLPSLRTSASNMDWVGPDWGYRRYDSSSHRSYDTGGNEYISQLDGQPLLDFTATTLTHTALTRKVVRSSLHDTIAPQP